MASDVRHASQDRNGDLIRHDSDPSTTISLLWTHLEREGDENGVVLI